jgi:hypothetical protein
MRKSTKVILIFSLFLVLFSFSAYAESVVFNNPQSNATLNGTIVLDATTDYNCTIATFYYSNTSNPWQSFIGDNTTSDDRNFTFIFDTNILSDGVYNFTVNVTNSTLENFTTSTNITIGNPPKWFNNISSIQSGSQYAPGQLYQFNITWIDDSIANVTFESNFSTLNETLVIITASNESNTYFINFTDLPAKNFVYRWIANDTSGNSNTTGNLTYTIANNSSTIFSLTLNGTENNASFRQYQNATFTASLNVPNKTIFLNSSYPLWANITTNLSSFASNTINLTTLGNFSIISYWIGDENYSASNKTYYFNVTDLNFLGNNTTIPSGSNYSTTANYNFSINLTGSVSGIIFEANFLSGTQRYTTNNSTTYNNITIQKNGETYWINFPPLAANSSGYTYRWYANDTNNVWINSGPLSYVINPYVMPPSITYSGSGPPWTTTNSSLVTLICSYSFQATLTVTGGISSWYCFGSGVNSASCTFTTGSTSGSDIYTCSVSGNYTGSTSGTLSWDVPIWNTPPSGGSGGASSGSFTITPSSSSVELEPGSSKIITLALKNTFSNDMININISVSGLNLTWYSLDKTAITRIKRDGGNDTVKLTLNIPQDAERKTYSIIVTASGKDGFTLNSISRQTTITLTVPEQEAPQNATTENVSNESTVNATSNETVGPTGLTIRPEDFRNIVLFIGLIAVGLVFLFRSNVTNFFMRGHVPTKPGKEIKKEEAKKPSVFSSIKNKIHGFSERKLVIQLKKKEKEEKT